MRIYARGSWLLVRQVVADLFVVIWTVAWWFIGRIVDRVVLRLAAPARKTAVLSDDLSSQLSEVARRAGDLPVVGDGLRRPFDGMSNAVTGIADAAQQQVEAIERTATVLGWLAFVIPVTVLLVYWLPWRLRFVRRSGEVLNLLATTDGDDLLALRALATQPLPELRRVAPDPVSAWRIGDRVVTARLAELELIKAGVARPRSQPRETLA